MGVGCAGYRGDAVKILVGITDEMDECTDCSSDSAMAAGMALRTEGITFIGIDADSGHEPFADLSAICTESGSLDGTGMPLVISGDGAAAATAVTMAINEVVEGVPLRVTIEAVDEPDDSGDSLQFIDYLVINSEAEGCATGLMTEDTNGDGHQDAFPSLLPGTDVCWDVVPRMNTTEEPSTEPRVFRARLTVSGDGSPLDTRVIYFLIPPRIDDPGIV